MILNAQEIIARMSMDFPKKLVITPILSKNQISIGNVGVDIRLGQEFIIAERNALDSIDPLKQPDNFPGLTSYLKRVHVPIGDAFVLHPRQFALGVTLEYCKLPLDLCADVIGRSRWARVGLVIAMATFVRPGYAGCLTLELQNLGDIPINLSPGIPIAQLIFKESIPITNYTPSQFQCSIGPEFPELVDTDDKEMLAKFRKQREFTI